jgi:hypothetical protein
MPWVHRGLLALFTRKVDFLLDFGEEEWTTRRGTAIKSMWTPRDLDKLVRHFTYREVADDPDSAELPIFTVTYDEAGLPSKISMVITENTLVMWPRGFSKTTLANAAVIWRAVYKESFFPCYVGETQTHAETQLGNVKKQFETNTRLRAVFGELKPAQRSGLKWAQDVVQLTNGVAIAARSRGGQVRGLVIDAQRPDWIILDDVEDKESVSTADQRSKTESWFMGDLMPATSEMDDTAFDGAVDESEASIIMLATLLHSEALAQKNRESPEWTSIVFGALDKDGDPLWAAKLGLEKLERKKLSYVRRGRLAEFYLEYFNTIRAEETQKFKQSFFIHRMHAISDCDHIALCMDPAIAEGKNSDSCTFGVVGIQPGGQLIVYHCDGGVGLSPREQIDTYFSLHRTFSPTKCGVETIAYQKALVHLMREEMFRKKQYFEIIPIGHYRQAKKTRIEGILQPRYAAGYIHHVKPFPMLESQLLDFPAGHDDYPDVISMCIWLLDPYAAQAGLDDDPAAAALEKDEYEPLVIKWAAP